MRYKLDYLYFSLMKKSFILILLLLPLLFFSFVLPKQTKWSYRTRSNYDTSFNLLTAYGKYIYQQENCNKCHTCTPLLDSNKISLENIAGKYPDSWHYNHLYDPRMMSPGSNMPRYYGLMKAPLSYKVILQLLSEEYTTVTEADSLDIRQTLEMQANAVLQVLKRDNITPSSPVYNEAIALIAWLQYRPDTPERRHKDSLQKENSRRSEEQMMASLESDLSNPESQIMKLANSKDPAILKKGKNYFSISCAVCHRENANGSIGPNLTDDYWLHDNSIKALFLTIFNGVPDHAMPAWKHSIDKERIATIIAFIRSLKGSNPPNPKEPQGEKRSD